MAILRTHPARPHAARRNHFLLGLTALTLCAHEASAAITFDLRASGIDTGLGALQDGKNITLDTFGPGAGTVSLQIWAQLTNAAPTSPVFGIYTMLGSVKSSSGGGTAPVTGSLSTMSFQAPFNNQSVAGTVQELTSPADGILDVGSNGTTVTTAFPKARKDPTSGGTQVPGGTIFYASNLDPAGATVQPITNGYEFLMGTFTFSISSFVSPVGTFSLNWAIPAFTTPANRGQIAGWTDGSGVQKVGSTNFAEMSVGAPINFTVAPVETTWISNTGGSWNDLQNWSVGVPNSPSTNAIFGSAITGPAVVTMDGDKTLNELTLDSANPYLLSQGSGGRLAVQQIRVISGSHTIGVPVFLGNSLYPTVIEVMNAGDTLTISGSIYRDTLPAWGLRKTGAGTLSLTGLNTYQGSTLMEGGVIELNTSGGNSIVGYLGVQDGEVRLKQSNQIADTSTVNISGGTLNIGNQAETVGEVILSGGSITGSAGTLISLTPFNLTAGSVSAILGGTVGLNKTGSGTVILTGANTYSGLTTVSGGTLQGNTTSLPGDILNNASVVFDQTDAGTRGANISGTGTVTKSGPGTLTFIGANSYSGATIVNAGTLELNTTGANAISGNATVAGGVLRLLQSEQIANGGTMTMTGGIFEMGTFSETVGGLLLNGATITGTGTLTSLSDFNIQSGSVSVVLAGAVGLAKSSTSSAMLTGANTYTGTTTITNGLLELNTTGANAVVGNVAISAGTLGLVQSDQIADTSSVVMTGGFFSLNGQSETVAGVQMTNGSITNGGTLTSLTAFDLRGGTVLSSLAGSVGLSKTTTETLTLYNANTYTGTTSVSAGTLRLNATGVNSVAGPVAITGGTVLLMQGNQIADTSNVHLQGGAAVLDLGANSETVNGVRLEQGSITGSGVLTSVSDFALESGSVSARLAGNVGVSKTTSSTVTLAGANTYTGQTQVSGGVLQLNATGGNAIPGNVAVNGATLRLQQSHQIADSAGVTLLNATLDLGSNSETVNAVQLAGGGITGSGTLTSLTDFVLESGSVSARLAGNVGLVKNSGASATLGGANTYTGLTTVNAGTLDLSASGANAVSGNVSVAGGQLRLLQSNQIADTASVMIANGGAGIGNFTLAFNTTETVAGVRLISGAITGTGTLSSLSDFEIESGIASARLGGNVGLTKTTGGTASLTGQNTYTGPTRVNEGTLNIAGQTNSSSFVVEDDATLGIVGATLNLTSGSLRANAGGAIEYTDATVNGGFLRGPGTHTVLAGVASNFNGVTSFNSTNLVQNGTANLTNFTNGGQITNGATLNWDGGANSSSGRLAVNGTVNVRDWTNDGVVTVNNGGVLASTGSDLVSGGGGRITIENGGALNIESGRSLELQGSLLVNNGTITGRTEVYYGGTAKGGGVFGPVAVFDGGRFSPGNSPGTATINGTYEWGAGGSVDFEIADALGVAGATTGWDLTKVIGPDGFLDIAAGTTSNSRFTIRIASNDATTALPAVNFDSSLPYQWLMVDTTQGVLGFDPAEIAIDASRFLNPLDGGAFSVASDGGKLFVQFSPVPEPSGVVLVLAGLGMLGFRRSRRASR